MVTVDEVRGQENGDNEGQDDTSCNDGLAHVVTYIILRFISFTEALSFKAVTGPMSSFDSIQVPFITADYGLTGAILRTDGDVLALNGITVTIRARAEVGGTGGVSF